MSVQHPTTPDRPDRFLLLTLAFTQSDRARDYSSFADGYQLGARQIAVTVTVEAAGLDLAPEAWAEAVFIASNDPTPPPAEATTPVDRAVAAIRHALTTQARFPLRSFSVGDTVIVGGVMLACQSVGWQAVTGLSRPAGQTPGDVEKR
jgi:hypothetical protein